ncbi:MAG: NAD(P)/FAD-dependent oxidoreductase [Acidobacteria bacterium]|nr:NAD(P)/FAD-dependent oxidoreductase [Acidobacteriota bacterium]
MSDFDVIIVGGGPAGAGAAIHLARAGASVLLAEQRKFPRAKLCGEFISPECLGHFARLGVLEEMECAGGASVSETVFYTQSGRSVAVPSAWFGGGQGGALGLSRAEMDSRLLARARAVGVEVLEEASFNGLLIDGARRVRGVRLKPAVGGERVISSLVTIDATGRQRVVARRFERETGGGVGGGIGAGRARPTLVAFKAHLKGAQGDARSCEIYFFRGGYGGLSPVEGGLSNLCFIARARDVRAGGSDAGRVMREVLMRNTRAAETLKGARAVTEWLGVALESFGRHEPVPAQGLMAIGDAAAFIDPFTGSGMLMALESGELAAAVLSDWLPRARTGGGSGLDFGTLASVYRARYGERFDARLRLCGLLRRAAFAPPSLTDIAARALSSSARLRRVVARATRGHAHSQSA